MMRALRLAAGLVSLIACLGAVACQLKPSAYHTDPHDRAGAARAAGFRAREASG
jgi:hypothetical protein